jgi:hypothetical protein
VEDHKDDTLPTNVILDDEVAMLIQESMQ